MFDPHRTRRSDSRYFTRKGQVIQASRVNTNPVIDQKLVPIYKNYILKNGLIPKAPPPPAPIKPIGIAISDEDSDNPTYYPFADMTLDARQTISLEFPAQSQARALLLFSQQKDGSFLFEVVYFQSSYQYYVVNNVKCYYKTIDIPNKEDFVNARKSLYHTSPSKENRFLTMDVDIFTQDTSQELIIPPEMNIAI